MHAFVQEQAHTPIGMHYTCIISLGMQLSMDTDVIVGQWKIESEIESEEEWKIESNIETVKGYVSL